MSLDDDAAEVARWIAANVVAERERQGMSQEELAEVAGIDIGTLQRLERATQSPSLRTIVGVAKALRKPAGELFAEATFRGRGRGRPRRAPGS